MSTLKHLRSRLRSVKATQKITTAMKLVSAAKLRKAQRQLQGFIPYHGAVMDLWEKLIQNEDFTAPEWLTPRGENHLYIVLMSDRGLCGSYNATMARHIKHLMEDQKRYSYATKILPIGHKAVDLLKSDLGKDFQAILFPDRERKTTPESVIEGLFNYLEAHLQTHSYQCVRIFYTQFVNILHQNIKHFDIVGDAVEEEVVPKNVSKNSYDSPSKDIPQNQPCKESTFYLFEPGVDTLEGDLTPLCFKNKLRYALYESLTSEQAARMRAMDTATENAKDVITSLNRTYNRTRQANITRELIEIISGANALHV